MQIRKLKDKVKGLLTDYPALRDSDPKLIINIWAEKVDYKKMTGEEVLTIIASGKLGPAEGITRCRRKIMELYPELRGLSYKPRMKEQANVIEQIRDFEK